MASFFDRFKETISEAVNSASQTISDAVSSASQTISDTVSSASQFFTDTSHMKWDERIKYYESLETVEGYVEALCLIDFHRAGDDQLVELWSRALQKRPEFAFDIYDKVLIKNSPELWHKIHEIHIKALDHVPMDQRGIIEKVVTCIEYHKFHDLDAGLKKLVVDYDYDPDLMTQAAEGNWDLLESGVMDNCSDISNKEEFSQEVAHALASFAESVNNPDKAISYIKRYLPNAGNALSLRWRLALLYRDQENWNEYINSLKTLCIHDEKAEHKIDIYFEMARIYLDIFKDEENAENAYRSILKEDPANEEANRYFFFLIKSLQKCADATEDTNKKSELNSQIASIHEMLFDLTNDDKYKTIHTAYEAELKKQNDEHLALLISDYADHKNDIYNYIIDSLVQKNYSSAAEAIEKYYSVAKDDNSFNDIIQTAKQTATSIRTNTLHNQLTVLNPNDIKTQKEIYTQLFKLNPFDANYLAKLDALESSHAQIDIASHQSVGIDESATIDYNQAAFVVEPIPAAIEISDASLQRIIDQDTIEKIANFFTSAACICHQGADISQKIGDWMHKYSNHPAIQITSIIPGAAQVSPTMEAISMGSHFVSQILSKGENFLNEAADSVDAINGTILAIIKTGDDFASACKALADVPLEIVSELLIMTKSLTNYIVGGYYLSEINSKLDEIQSVISRISDFQDNEYQSKVIALCAQISKMTQFRTEIIQNDDLCRRELMKLSDYEHECIELIGQANIALSKTCSSPLTKYETYENNLKELAKWYQYQDSLLRVLSEISKFTFTLNKGTVSIENCSTLFRLYEKQVLHVRETLKQYHHSAIAKFEIDLSEKTHKVQSEPSSGFFTKLTSLLDSNSTQTIADDLIDIIDIQMNQIVPSIQSQNNLYKKDLRIVFKDNAFYYLPNTESENNSEFDINWILSVLKKGE